MTTNQSRAILLARALCDGVTDPAALSDSDWHLLLLAAGENHANCCGHTAARKALQAAQSKTGYFTPRDPRRPRRPRRPRTRAAVAA